MKFSLFYFSKKSKYHMFLYPFNHFRSSSGFFFSKMDKPRTYDCFNLRQFFKNISSLFLRTTTHLILTCPSLLKCFYLLHNTLRLSNVFLIFPVSLEVIRAASKFQSTSCIVDTSELLPAYFQVFYLLPVLLSWLENSLTSWFFPFSNSDYKYFKTSLHKIFP